MIKYIILFLLFISCISNNDDNNIIENRYVLHKNITVTVFYVGEKATPDNNFIDNISSVWDDNWLEHYGGFDDPTNRNNYYPKNFIPKENPFYFALPYNDFDENGNLKKDIINYIPWATEKNIKLNQSICKNRWIKIIKNNKIAFAQWEDAGPFGEDDINYVFFNKLPKNIINNNAGLDVSPAVRDYLNLSDIDKIDWQFVEYEDVFDGPWKNIITSSNIFWK